MIVVDLVYHEKVTPFSSTLHYISTQILIRFPLLFSIKINKANVKPILIQKNVFKHQI